MATFEQFQRPLGETALQFLMDLLGISAAQVISESLMFGWDRRGGCKVSWKEAREDPGSDRGFIVQEFSARVRVDEREAGHARHVG